MIVLYCSGNNMSHASSNQQQQGSMHTPGLHHPQPIHPIIPTSPYQQHMHQQPAFSTNSYHSHNMSQQQPSLVMPQAQRPPAFSLLTTTTNNENRDLSTNSSVKSEPIDHILAMRQQQQQQHQSQTTQSPQMPNSANSSATPSLFHNRTNSNTQFGPGNSSVASSFPAAHQFKNTSDLITYSNLIHNSNNNNNHNNNTPSSIWSNSNGNSQLFSSNGVAGGNQSTPSGATNGAIINKLNNLHLLQSIVNSNSKSPNGQQLGFSNSKSSNSSNNTNNSESTAAASQSTIDMSPMSASSTISSSSCVSSNSPNSSARSPSSSTSPSATSPNSSTASMLMMHHHHHHHLNHHNHRSLLTSAAHVHQNHLDELASMLGTSASSLNSIPDALQRLMCSDLSYKCTDLSIVDAIKSIQIDLNSMDVCQSSVGLLEKWCFLMVDWARQSLYFKEIKIDDQIKLLKNSWIDILLLDLMWKQCRSECSSTNSIILVI